MQIASVLIGGVEMVQSTLLRGFTISRDISQRTGRATIIIFAKPAELVTTVASAGPGALFNESGFGTVISPITPALFGGPTTISVPFLLAGATIEIWDGTGPPTGGILFGQQVFGSPLTADTLRFAGRISKITPRALTLKEGGLGYTEYTLECQDYTVLLDTAVIPPTTLPAGSDQDAIRYIIDNALPGIIDTTDVDSITTLDAMELSSVTARQALETICQLSGGNFWVDENKALHYHSPSVTPAPFGISDTPDNVTTFAGLFGDYQYSEDFSNPGNHITVIGGGDAPPEVELNDLASQSTYGAVFSRVFRDESLKTIAAVTARANVELARFKQPLKTGRFVIDQRDGLDVGQLLPIVNQALGINGTFLIRRVTIYWVTPSWTRFTIDFGDLNADLVRFLRSLNSLTAKQPKFNSSILLITTTGTWTAPANVTKVTVECWGPGGYGNQGQAVGGTPGGGGGGGAKARSSDIPVVPGTVYTVTVPAGSSELPTWFGSPTTILAAPGIHGDHGDLGGGGGLGGQAADSIGSETWSGVNGSAAGAGGGAGGTAGGTGGAAGGAGGTSPGGNGVTADPPGGGGGGGGNNGGSGGGGGAGRVQLTFSVG